MVGATTSLAATELRLAARVVDDIARELGAVPVTTQLASDAGSALQVLQRRTARLHEQLPPDAGLWPALRALEQAHAGSGVAASAAGARLAQAGDELVRSLDGAGHALRAAADGAASLGAAPAGMHVDRALGAATHHALDELPEARSVLGRSELPLQRPLLGVLGGARRALVGRHVVEGLERIPAGGLVIAPNHSTMLDMTMLPVLRSATSGPLRPMKVAGYSPVRRALVDPVLERAGAFTVQAGGSAVRGHPGVTRGDVAVGISSRLASRGDAVVIFPEGRLVASDTVFPLYDGAVRAALESGAPLVPVATWGTKPGAAAHDGLRGALTIVGDPIAPPAAGAITEGSVRALGARLHGAMLDLHDQARSGYARALA